MRRNCRTQRNLVQIFFISKLASKYQTYLDEKGSKAVLKLVKYILISKLLNGYCLILISPPFFYNKNIF